MSVIMIDYIIYNALCLYNIININVSDFFNVT